MFDLHHNARALFGAAWGVFLLLSLAVAVGPALWTQEHNQPLPTSHPLSAQARRGQQVYISEGCPYCHTQQVRPVSSDEVFGRPSVPGDYARLHRPSVWEQTPAVLGSERTGPDLSNIGKRQPSRTWNLIHLYNPRAVVKDSVMPQFPWLFEEVDHPGKDQRVVPVPPGYAPAGKKVVATARARDLVAYLLSRKQAPLPGQAGRHSGHKGAASAGGGANASDRGAKLFASTCASCHQADGKGLPATFPPLAADPVVTAKDPTQHVRTVLTGLHGKKIGGVSYAAAMPSFADSLSDADLAAIVNHERTSWGNHAPTVTAAQVAKVRAAVEAGQGGSHE